MQTLRKFRFLIVLLIPTLLFAQNTDDVAKEKQRRRSMLIEQVLADLPGMKLAENRAILYAKVGNLLWDSDQKRALSLFQNAVGELMNAQMLAESNQKAAAYQNELLTGGSTRPQVLNIIASHDAELALDLLIKTRPAAVIKALSMPTVKSSKISNYQGNFSYLAQNEINLEQSFVRLAADQNPERAAKLLKESLAKGISNETLNLLKKLAEKDAESASDFASRFVDKLIQDKFTIENQPNYQILQTTISFLNEFITDKNSSDHALKFDDSQMHRLADKLFSYYLDQGNYASYNNYSIIPLAEKLSPSIVEQLKKIGSNNPRRSIYASYDPDTQKLLGGDATADQLLAEAKKYPVNLRRQLYQTAAEKLVQQGNMDRAVGILNENFSDDALDDALRNLNWQYSNNLINNGNFAQAEQVIDELPENTRTNALIGLANAIYQQNSAENRSYALAVLGKARSLISEKPENSTEMSNLMQVIGAYANIEPTEAFRLYEPLVSQMCELSDAAAVINGFQGGSNVRDGEFLMTQGDSYGFYGADFYVLRTFARNDFDRTVRLIDSFTRREMRISLKLRLVEGGLE